MLRKYKICLNRNNLEITYFTYISPLLEYACELWDGCTILGLNKIEQIQHEATGIVTGLPIFASIESLYFETGWEPLFLIYIYLYLFLISKLHGKEINIKIQTYLHQFSKGSKQIDIR